MIKVENLWITFSYGKSEYVSWLGKNKYRSRHISTYLVLQNVMIYEKIIMWDDKS